MNNLKEIFIFILVFFVIQFLLKKWMTKGELKFKQITKSTSISILVIIPMLLIMNMINDSNKELFLKYFFVGYLILLMVYVVFKKVPKEYYYPLIIGFTLYALALFFDNIMSIICLYSGLGFFIYGFYIIRKNPYYYYEWINSIVEETINEIDEKGIYSSKPFIIKIDNQKEFFTKGKGIKIWFKKDKIIYKMHRKKFYKLGEPKLDLFYSKLTEKILEKIK